MSKGAKKFECVQSNDVDFARLGGFVSFHKLPGDAGYKARPGDAGYKARRPYEDWVNINQK